MAKRHLPPGYRLGVVAFLNLLRLWTKEMRDEPVSCAADMRIAVADQPESFRIGFEECIALYIQTVIEGSAPYPEQWDPIRELEDLHWYKEDQGDA
ncbi:hypothetical protein [Burkholderia orbicola]|uniref:hypothetical protein n=1 Tax=Burkholderia orbicola TaxID=2978683 RepID=UPI00264FFD30|nr:hypothetical protein [Burkholderia orbicola]MDN7558191.1 hypothetical protein [Burkholderia orbicola]